MLYFQYILTICLFLCVCNSKKTKYQKKPTTTEVPSESTAGYDYGVVSTNAATDGWMPFSYSYTADVGSYGDTGMISASQSGNSDGVVTGSYSLEVSNGQMRQVVYKADKTGFYATVKTNEQGTANEDPANIHIISSYEQNSEAPSTAGDDSGTEATDEAVSTEQDDYETTEASEVTTEATCECKKPPPPPKKKPPPPPPPPKKCNCYKKKATTTKKPKKMTTKASYKKPKPKTTTKAPYKKKTTKPATTKKYLKTKKPKTTTKKPKPGQQQEYY
ncbi:cuticular protein-like protein [Leptotrombidium deliense]|uniref:Cuticular protein-like protein n=1 Tax=Leptotrombidium deliense TaxID=299467 RepID=A0A443SQ48_9ACAR|nr:cuticular protein-like protein [Leptotrombidium deliense]